MSPVSVLLELGADVEWPDDDAAAQMRAQLGEGAGALGALAAWLASAQASVPPREPKRIRLVRLGAETADLPSWAPADVGARSETCTHADAEASVRFGAQLADDEVDRGADL
ncbi:MAG TPA: hypothetical protein VJ831_01825, partial [Jatrophihabitantaceae bacterium]|nr:hypothetical protein [Jatrophihabitantaceae bacterium]